MRLKKVESVSPQMQTAKRILGRLHRDKNTTFPLSQGRSKLCGSVSVHMQDGTRDAKACPGVKEVRTRPVLKKSCNFASKTFSTTRIR